MNETAIIPRSVDEAQGMASRLAVSSIIDSRYQKRPEDVLAVILTGAELGLAPMQSLRGIRMIDGKPTMMADMMGALVMSKRDVCEYLRCVESTEQRAVYETKRKGSPKEDTLTFTIEQATKAGLASKDNWRKYPQAMLRARALSAICRMAYPDLVAGVYDPEELETGRHVDVSIAPQASPPRTKTDEVKARVERILGKGEETVDATFTTPKPEPVAVTTFEKRAAEVTTEREPGSDEDPGPKLGFNPDGHEGLKGRSIASLTGPQLAAAIATAEAKLKGSAKAPWAAKLSANLTELREESDARHAAVEAQS